MNSNEFQGVRLLVVDDEPMARKLLRMILQKMGVAEIAEAEDGEKALEFLAAEEGQIDLVISDIHMPNLDGWELARRIRYGAVERFKEVPILILTSNPSDQNTRKARIHKISGFVVKPAKRENLTSLMRDSLKR